MRIDPYDLPTTVESPPVSLSTTGTSPTPAEEGGEAFQNGYEEGFAAGYEQALADLERQKGPA